MNRIPHQLTDHDSGATARVVPDRSGESPISTPHQVVTSLRLVSFIRCRAWLLCMCGLLTLLPATPVRAQLIVQDFVRSDDSASPPVGAFFSVDNPQTGAPGAPVFRAFYRDGFSNVNAIYSGRQLVARTSGEGANNLGTNGLFNSCGPTIANSNGAVAFHGTAFDPSSNDGSSFGYWTNANGSLEQIAKDGGPAPGTNDTFLLANTVTSLGAFNAAGEVAFRAPLKSDSGSEPGVWMGKAGALRFVARTGQQADGFPAGEVYTTVGQDLRLNNAGELAFFGVATIPGVSSRSAIWAGKPGALQVVVKSGDPAPDTSAGTTLTFNQGASGFNALGQVSFTAAINANTGSTAAIYAGARGALRLVARTSSQAPGLEAGGIFDGLDAPVINAGGEVFFGASFSSPSVVSGLGLWAGRPGELRLIAKTGDVAPETGGARYSGSFPFTPLLLSDSGRVVFFAQLDGPSATSTALFMTDRTGAVRLIARYGGSLAGSPPVTQLSLEPDTIPFPRAPGQGLPVSIDANNQLAFFARWAGAGNGFLGREAIFLAQFKEDVPPRLLWGAGRDLRANETADAAPEVNATNATVPEWSYGFRAAAESTAFTPFPAETHGNADNGVDGWSTSGNVQLLVNTTSAPIVFNTGSGNFKPLFADQIYINPGPPGNFVVTRWTAPTDGSYRFVAKWVDLDNHGGNGVTTHFVVNGKQEFQEIAESTSVKAGKGRLRSRTIDDIKAGDVVDFLVGSNGDPGFDGTAFNAAVYRVPKVTITSPVGGTTLTDTQDIPVSVNIEHVEAVQKVQLRVDGENVAEDREAPYQFNVRLDSGTHVLTAVATDLRKSQAKSADVEILVTEGGSSGTASAKTSSGEGASRIVAASSGGRVFESSRSGGWDEPSTWEDGSSGVPGPNDHAIIKRGHSVGLRTANTVVKHLNVNGRLASGAVPPPTVTVNGNLYANNEIIGTLTLVIGPQGKFLNIARYALLFDVTLINNGSMLITGDQFDGANCTVINNGRLTIAPPPATDYVAHLPVAKVEQNGLILVPPSAQLTANSLIGNDGSTLIGNDGSTLIGNDGSTLIGNDGSTLIGNDGSTLIGNDGSTLVGNDGASLIGPDGGRLIGLDSATLVAAGGGNLLTPETQASDNFPQAAVDPQGVILNGGTISGSGEIRANVVNKGGFILPGNSAGALLVNGNYTQEGAATLLLEVGGLKAAPLEYDIFQVTGNASLGGKLIVKTINGYTPAAGDSFSPLLYGSHTGSFASVSSNAQVTFDSTGMSTQVSGPNPPAPKALNISTRMRVETGDNVLIAGFIVTGSSPKKVLVRGIGPSLPVSGALADPVLELDNGAIINDDWKSTQEQAIRDTTIPPTSDLEAAIVTTLQPGPHTAVLRGKNDGTGVGLVEVYDLETGSPVQLANISTRGQVQTGDDVMIGGFIIAGDYPAKVLLRAIGPSLAEQGVSGALQDPTLELVDGQGNTISNDNWRATQEAEIAAILPPNADAESAIITTLVPGAYTAIVRGQDDTIGVALVEGYNLQ